MTVGELIEKLKTYPNNYQVVVYNNAESKVEATSVSKFYPVWTEDESIPEELGVTKDMIIEIT